MYITKVRLHKHTYMYDYVYMSIIKVMCNENILHE